MKLFFWHSDHQREKLLWVCGWKGHVLGQLDEVSAVSLQCIDVAPPSSPHPFPSQPGYLNSFHIFLPLFHSYHALSFQKTSEKNKNIACDIKIQVYMLNKTVVHENNFRSLDSPGTLSVQSLSLVWPFVTSLQHARLPCPSPTPGVHPNSCPSSQWCHPAISSSVIPFSSCLQSLPESDSFPMNQIFTWGGQSIGFSASASVLPMNTQD